MALITVRFVKVAFPYLLRGHSMLGSRILRYCTWINLPWDEWKEIHFAVTHSHALLLGLGNNLRYDRRGFFSPETIALIEASWRAPDGEEKDRCFRAAHAAIRKERDVWDALHPNEDAKVGGGG